MTTPPDSVATTNTVNAPAPAKSEQAVALEALIDAGLVFADAVAAFSARQSDTDRKFVRQARVEWEKEGQIEIDDNAIASGSTDRGDYVMAWLWVSDASGDEEGDYRFDLDYGVHVNGDDEALSSARNLEVGDTFRDPAYDERGEWHIVDDLWMEGSAVHIDEDDDQGEAAADMRKHGHRAHPDDDSEPGDGCGDCGEDVTRPVSGQNGWLHADVG